MVFVKGTDFLLEGGEELAAPRLLSRATRPDRGRHRACGRCHRELAGAVALINSRGRATLTELFRDTFGVFFRHAWVFIVLSAAVVVPVHLVVEGIGLEMITGPYDDSPSVAETAVPTVVDFLVVSPIIRDLHPRAALHRLGRPPAGQPGLPVRLRGLHAAVLRGGARGARHRSRLRPARRAGHLPVRALVLRAPGRGDRERPWLAGARPFERGGAGVLVARTFGLVILINIAAALPALLMAAPFASIANSTGDAIWALARTILAASVTAPVARCSRPFSTTTCSPGACRRRNSRRARARA